MDCELTYRLLGWSQVITDNLFAYQQIFTEVIDIFEYDEIQKEFKKSKEVEIQKLSFDTNFFPLQYIDSKQLFEEKLGKCLNLIQKKDNNLKTEASIVCKVFNFLEQLVRMVMSY